MASGMLGTMSDPYRGSQKRQYGDQPKHHPTLYQTGRAGCWGFCACGWESPVLTNVMSVHLAFGIHLVQAEDERG